MEQWKIIGRLGGVAVKWGIGGKNADNVTITRERRRSNSGGLGGVRYVVRGHLFHEYRALTLENAKDHARFWVDVRNRKTSKIIHD